MSDVPPLGVGVPLRIYSAILDWDKMSRCWDNLGNGNAMKAKRHFNYDSGVHSQFLAVLGIIVVVDCIIELNIDFLYFIFNVFLYIYT